MQDFAYNSIFLVRNISINSTLAEKKQKIDTNIKNILIFAAQNMNKTILFFKVVFHFQ